MGKQLVQRPCSECGKKYLFGGVYCEEICIKCFSFKIYKRTDEQAERLVKDYTSHALELGFETQAIERVIAAHALIALNKSMVSTAA